MKNHLRVLIACVALFGNAAPSFANFSMSPSGTTTAFAIDAANQGTSLCAAASTECPATVLVNTAGAPIGVAAVPLQVSLANTGANATAVLVNQPTAANLNATVVQATGSNLHTVVDSGTVTTVSTVTNLAQMNGAALLMGNGVTGTGSQRVTIASDNTAFSVNLGTIGGAATAALQPTNAAQGSTTAAQTGPLVQCAVTTAAPTYTTAQTDPLSCATTGSLRVSVTDALGLAQGSTTSGQTGSMIMGAVTTGDPAYTTAQSAYASLDVKGHQRVVLGGGVPITASATGTTGATTATLATSASVTTYICGFSIRANATAAATGNATVTGTITGTLNYTQWTAPNASGLGVTEEVFTPCVPASAANTSIAVVSAAPSTGGVVSVSVWGYQQ